MGKTALADSFPRLYCIANQKNVTVQEVLSKGISSIEFRRTLHDATAQQWNELVDEVSGVELKDEKDRMR